ncbi:alpha/beta fold hydrolase [Streptomyces longispororuber]|uniref:alpha/beta fold hydrolase n=1 Tax=Streptomyces longispororuber TaxID=68230 RepID=UPI00167D39FE|nr:alpha/beta fold hydrolase [Streptomyces longispororuber]
MPELRVTVGERDVHVAVEGMGPAVLLLHGFPHTWELWREVMPALAARRTVIAPDLHDFGTGGPAAAGYDAGTDAGYDAGTLADDAAALLRALGVTGADVVGIDAGTPPAFLLAMRRPGLVRRLVVMESLLGRLPGAEEFLASGPPWWFGFHAVPGLAESVLAGNEARYVDWFLDAGTLGDGVPPRVRDAFVRAHTGRDALRRAFAPYRALPESAARIEQAVATARLTAPTLAVGAHPVGDALARQLRPVTDDLTARVLDDCGHIIPLHRPRRLLDLLLPFLAGEPVPPSRTPGPARP